MYTDGARSPKPTHTLQDVTMSGTYCCVFLIKSLRSKETPCRIGGASEWRPLDLWWLVLSHSGSHAKACATQKAFNAAHQATGLPLATIQSVVHGHALTFKVRSHTLSHLPCSLSLSLSLSLCLSLSLSVSLSVISCASP